MLNVIVIIPESVVNAVASELEKEPQDRQIPQSHQDAIKWRVSTPYRSFERDGVTWHGYDMLIESVDQIREMAKAYQFEVVGLWDCEPVVVTEGEGDDKHEVDRYCPLLQDDYPFDLNTYLELLPDEVTYDKEGNETSRKRPTTPYDRHLRSGQPRREFP